MGLPAARHISLTDAAADTNPRFSFQKLPCRVILLLSPLLFVARRPHVSRGADGDEEQRCDGEPDNTLSDRHGVAISSMVAMGLSSN
jgi:hypothetical protein